MLDAPDGVFSLVAVHTSVGRREPARSKVASGGRLRRRWSPLPHFGAGRPRRVQQIPAEFAQRLDELFAAARAHPE
ncbi:hypothetical protein [Micromonospora radicis]|uniref:Uncharacterized protein n=1 Tax=Micromonospora radicis TaxID=1894971 RepID=A0A418MYJ2_9ACTN|nr:hypothetical protein [Micromonospora radicis]RIV40270.1 hypothetical protein D2L64_05330 [Micromonospora radicis]